MKSFRIPRTPKSVSHQNITDKPCPCNHLGYHGQTMQSSRISQKNHADIQDITNKPCSHLAVTDNHAIIQDFTDKPCSPLGRYYMTPWTNNAVIQDITYKTCSLPGHPRETMQSSRTSRTTLTVIQDITGKPCSLLGYHGKTIAIYDITGTCNLPGYHGQTIKSLLYHRQIVQSSRTSLTIHKPSRTAWPNHAVIQDITDKPCSNPALLDKSCNHTWHYGQTLESSTPSRRNHAIIQTSWTTHAITRTPQTNHAIIQDITDKPCGHQDTIRKTCSHLWHHKQFAQSSRTSWTGKTCMQSFKT